MVLTMEELMIREGYPIHENFMKTRPDDIEDRSLFNLAIGIIKENDEIIHNMMDGGEVFLKEFELDGEEIYSFKQFIRKIIELFIRAIRNIFENFWSFISRITQNDKTIEKYADELAYYSRKVDMHGKGHFTFTYLDQDIPRADLKMNFMKEYEDLTDQLRKMSRYGNKNEVISNFNAVANEIKKDLYATREFEKKARENVLCGTFQGADVSQDGFSNVLFRMFRNWTDIPTRNDITSDEVHQAIDRFMQRKTLLKTTERHKRDIENNAKDIERRTKAIEASNIVSSKECMVDTDVQYAINQIIQLECLRLDKVCNIYTMAFAAKLDAIKAAIVQDRIVLFNTIDQILDGRK